MLLLHDCIDTYMSHTYAIDILFHDAAMLFHFASVYAADVIFSYDLICCHYYFHDY